MSSLANGAGSQKKLPTPHEVLTDSSQAAAFCATGHPLVVAGGKLIDDHLTPEAIKEYAEIDAFRVLTEKFAAMLFPRNPSSEACRQQLMSGKSLQGLPQGLLMSARYSRLEGAALLHATADVPVHLEWLLSGDGNRDIIDALLQLVFPDEDPEHVLEFHAAGFDGLATLKLDDGRTGDALLLAGDFRTFRKFLSGAELNPVTRLIVAKICAVHCYFMVAFQIQRVVARGIVMRNSVIPRPIRPLFGDTTIRIGTGLEFIRLIAAGIERTSTHYSSVRSGEKSRGLTGPLGPVLALAKSAFATSKYKHLIKQDDPAFFPVLDDVVPRLPSMAGQAIAEIEERAFGNHEGIPRRARRVAECKELRSDGRRNKVRGEKAQNGSTPFHRVWCCGLGETAMLIVAILRLIQAADHLKTIIKDPRHADFGLVGRLHLLPLPTDADSRRDRATACNLLSVYRADGGTAMDGEFEDAWLDATTFFRLLRQDCERLTTYSAWKADQPATKRRRLFRASDPLRFNYDFALARA